MKTLVEILRDADPLAYEPRRTVHERHMNRQAVLDAPYVGHDVPRRPFARATIAALVIVGAALSGFYWLRTAVDVIAAVRFEIRLAEENPAPGLREAVVVGTSRKIYVHSEAVVANRDIAQAQVVEGNGASMFGVSVTLNTEGGARIRRATQNHVGRPLAIIVDGEVVAAPVVRSPISTSALLSGNFTRAEAERIVGGILGR
jgi:hypothetical protein